MMVVREAGPVGPNGEAVNRGAGAAQPIRPLAGCGLGSREGARPMAEPLKDHLMHVEGMTSEECVEAVRQAIRHLDAGAEVAIDLAHQRIEVRTFAQAIDVAQALEKAGFAPTGMTL
jgi:copper chaperone